MTILDEADNRRNQPTRTLIMAAATISTVITVGMTLMTLSLLLAAFVAALTLTLTVGIGLYIHACRATARGQA